MNQASATFAQLQSVSPDAQKVMRNTCLLLALSMVPTVLGVILGVAWGINPWALGPIAGPALAIGGSIAFVVAIQMAKRSLVGVGLLLAFTLFMGLIASTLLEHTLNLDNGAALVAVAAGGTALILVGTSAIVTTSKRDFSNFGPWLFGALILLIVAGVANIFLQLSALQTAISVMSLAVFSGFLLYDLQRVIRGGETNYVAATLGIYLNLFNIFTSLLSLLNGGFGSRDE